MKISKLFHWLYAIIMLLPIFAIGVTCGYAMFNKNAYQSYSGNVEVSDTKQVTSLEDIINNRLFYVTEGITRTQTAVFNIKILDIYSATDNSEIFNSSNYEYDYFSMSPVNASTIAIYGQLNKAIDTTVTKTELLNFNWTSSSKNRFIPKLVFEDYVINENGSTNFLNFMSQFHYNIIYYQQTLDNIFYYSIDKVQQSPLFNWAENSFLVTPFAYIVNLFSMPTNSPIVMFLSYWLAISIIWLVFDLIMYVPLLVHRWLDKGVLE